MVGVELNEGLVQKRFVVLQPDKIIKIGILITPIESYIEFLIIS